MKKLIKRLLIGVGVLLLAGFIAFLYLIPPFTLLPPDKFSGPELAAAPGVAGITNPAERAIAEHGRYLVVSIGCSGCHTPGGDKGPKFDTEYLAGGMKFSDPHFGTSVSRNLTPDAATGLARRSDEQVKRTLRSGVFAEDGRIFNPFFMPWGEFSNLTEEDRHAIVVYLRTIKPVRHGIPDHSPLGELPTNGFFGLDYGTHEGGR
jgi:hypothetical protein